MAARVCSVGAGDLMRPGLDDAAVDERGDDRRIGPRRPRLGVGPVGFEVRDVAKRMLVGRSAVDGAGEQLATEVRRPTGHCVPPEFLRR